MKWKTKDGREIRIQDMEDSHLLNAHRHVRKTQQNYDLILYYADHPIWGPRGDGAQMAFESELNVAEEASYEAAVIKPYLEDEIKKRKLIPLPLPEEEPLPDGELVEDLGYAKIYKLKPKQKEKSKMKQEFFIAGVQHHSYKDVLNDLSEGDELTLKPEPTNRFDPNAVQILYEHYKDSFEDNDEPIMTQLGFVPRKFSSKVTGLLELGEELTCELIEVNKSAKPWEMLKVSISSVKETEDE
jgi:HIRAN domain